MFSEIIITVPDVDAAVAFYTDACRFKLVRTVIHDDAKVVELDAGGQRVSVVHGDEAGVHLVMDTQNLRADQRRLARLGIDEADAVKSPGGAFLPFRDPHGIRFAFFKPEEGEAG